MTAEKAGGGLRSKNAASLSSGTTRKGSPSLCRDSSTNCSASSVPASRKGSRAFRTTLTAAAAFGLFVAALAGAGYLAEHTPTPLAFAVCTAAIGVVFVRLLSDGGAR